MEPEPRPNRFNPTIPGDAVSWYQGRATLSLELFRRVDPLKSARIIDVGAGASVLADELLARGYRDLTVLDLSGAALDISRHRLGAAANRVKWVQGDITRVDLEPAFDVWHDRAVFHFLTDPADRAAYAHRMKRSVRPGGHVVLAAFGHDGPLRCGGLTPARYSAGALQAELGSRFLLMAHETEDHLTPWGSIQHFVFVVL